MLKVKGVGVIGWARNLKVSKSTFTVGLFTILLVGLIFTQQSTTSCIFVIPHEGCVLVEQVSTPAAREKGLSGRNILPVNRGMLFKFQEPGGYCFWMKDMKFNIDIIWLNDKKQIVDIKNNVSSDSYPLAYCPAAASQFVVEVNAGVAKQANLKTGQKLSF